MTLAKRTLSARLLLTALATALFLAACGGGSSGGSPAVETPAPTTGTFGLFITDKPSEDFAQINLDVVKAVLIGGDDSQQVLFDVADGDDPREIDLLDLTNFNEPIVFGEVAVGTYTKLRLVIENLELVPHDPNADPIVIDRLPANGKIDLLDQDGFDVLPGATLLADVDMDANKSIKVTGAGNSGKYKFRPVVKVQFINDDSVLEKLTRFAGFVTDPLDPAGSFALCKTEAAENCVDVMTGIDTSFFDIEGAPTDFTGVALASPVVVFGRYQVDPDVFLDALVVEIGGTAEQVNGFVSNPSAESFVLVARDESEFTVELQVGTRYFDADGEIGADAIVLGAAVEVEGVKLAKDDPADPDVMRAALVFVEAEDDDQISGTINSELTGQMFELLVDASTTVFVNVLDDADILLVNETTSEVTIGDITSLASGQIVELFGTTTENGFEANEIIVDVTP